ncbi:hypothetical protein [Chryseobacterium joostei]|nr:hypothetical protein [Chryseobacterium joostei]
MQQGRTVIMDEYANHNYGGFVGDLKIPNWIILMSDEHFKFIKNEPNFEK